MSSSEGTGVKYTVLYDGQCEVCQACFSWLRALDQAGHALGLPLENADLSALHSDLSMEDCLAELHILDETGKIYKGWKACAVLAKISPWTWPIGALGAFPPFSWLGGLFYKWIAQNRYLISKCRGGACHTAKTEHVRRKASFLPFWSCYFFGLLVRTPLSLGWGLKNQWKHLHDWIATFRRRHELLEGSLTVMFVGGVEPEIVPLVFGERFCAILYKGVLFDPGSVKMRGSLLRHFKGLPPNAVRHVVGTHHHEEHVGNLELAARHFKVPLWLSPKTLEIARDYPRLPWARGFTIGQPENIGMETQALGDGQALGDTG